MSEKAYISSFHQKIDFENRIDAITGTTEVLLKKVFVMN